MVLQESICIDNHAWTCGMVWGNVLQPQLAVKWSVHHAHTSKWGICTYGINYSLHSLQGVQDESVVLGQLLPLLLWAASMPTKLQDTEDNAPLRPSRKTRNQL